jgi:hypothetical protein
MSDNRENPRTSGRGVVKVYLVYRGCCEDREDYGVVAAFRTKQSAEAFTEYEESLEEPSEFITFFYSIQEMEIQGED